MGGLGGCNNVNVDTFLILAFVIFCVFAATL